MAQGETVISGNSELRKSLGFLDSFFSCCKKPFVVRKIQHPSKNAIGRLMPIPEKLIRQSRLEEIWKSVVEAEKLCQTIVIYSQRKGVGLTTVLRFVNNRLLEMQPCWYDFVIFCRASSNDASMCEQIAQSIGLSDTSEWKLQTEVKTRSGMIYNELQNKRFVLLLDDASSGPVDLKQLGVPYPTLLNGCKIVYASCSELCLAHRYPDKSIMVELWSEEDAWSLFSHEFRNDALLLMPDIHSIVGEIIELCQGLPKAVSNLARLMRSNGSNIQKWQYELSLLKAYTPPKPITTPSLFYRPCDDRGEELEYTIASRRRSRGEEAIEEC